MKTKNYTRHNRLPVRAFQCVAAASILALVCSPLLVADTAGDRAAVTATPEEQQEVIRLAREDHGALLNMLIERYDKTVHDYTGIFHKQERINGKLTPEQKIAFNFRQKPFSVFMEWLENPVGASKLLYVEGRHDGKMLAHPTGLMGFVKSVKIDPEGKRAAKSSLHPVTRFGFRSNLAQTLEVYRTAADKGHVQVTVTGPESIHGRQVLTFERTLTGDEYQNPRLTVRLDLEYLVPTEITAVDENGDLLSHYTYTDLTFNTGLTDQDFDPKTHGLD